MTAKIIALIVLGLVAIICTPFGWVGMAIFGKYILGLDVEMAL